MWTNLFTNRKNEQVQAVSVDPDAWLESSPASTVDAVFAEIKSLFPAGSENLDVAYQAAQALTGPPREQALIRAYLGLETKLLQKNFTSGTAVISRLQVRQKVADRIVDKPYLGRHFALLFHPESRQVLGLAGLLYEPVSGYLAASLGAAHFDELVVKVIRGTALAQADMKVRESKFAGDLHLFTAPAKDLVTAFSAVFAVCYQQTVTALSQVQAVGLFSMVYARLRVLYDGAPDLIKMTLELLPPEQFAGERLWLTHSEQMEQALAPKKTDQPEKPNLEAQLQKERDQVQAILNSMGESLVVVDKEGLIVQVNRATENLLGYEAGKMVGKAWEDLVHVYHGSEQIGLQDGHLQRALVGGEDSLITVADDISYESLATGKRFPVAVTTTVLLASSGKKIAGVAGAILVFQDISKEKESKTIIERTVIDRTRQLTEKTRSLEKAKGEVAQGWFQLQREKARLTASINSLALGFIMTDIAENIIIMNPAAEKILNTPKLAAVRLSDIGAKLKGAVDLRKMQEEVLQTKKIVQVKDVLLGATHMHFMLTPIIMNSGQGDEEIGTALIINDITEAKILERSKDEFFSIASHELRTPLTAIRGNAELIKSYYDAKLSDPQFTGMVDDIYQASIRLIGIVNDFLNVSRLEQGRIEFKKEAFDLPALAREVVAEYQSLADGQKTKLVIDQLPASLPSAWASRDKTKEVYINLVGNALKFVQGGEVKISIGVENGLLTVHVADTGRGIPLEMQPLLFHKFQQAGESLYTRDTTKGTGLGLYISKLLVEGMGGKIWLVSSVSDKGTEFAFTLPVAK